MDPSKYLLTSGRSDYPLQALAHALLLITDIHGQDGQGVPTSRAIIVHASWLRNYKDINELVLSGLKWILQNVCLPPAGPTAHCKPLHDALLLITDIHSQDKWGVRVGRAVVTVAGVGRLNVH